LVLKIVEADEFCLKEKAQNTARLNMTNSIKDSTKELRVQQVNQFLQTVASCGRQFFRSGDRVSQFDVHDGGHVTYLDNFSQRLIEIEKLSDGFGPSKDWKYFSNGSNLRELIVALGQFIHTGEQPHLNLGPWPGRSCLWAYGEHMAIVRAAAESNGLRPQPPVSVDTDVVATETPKG
jgi:hypothetical protein